MPPEENDNIASRSISGSFYSVAASAVTIGLGFIRTVLLTMFIVPADAGVVVQALFFITLASLLRLPGMNIALVHREDVSGRVLPTYFTMRLGLLVFSLAITAAFVPLISHFYPGMPLLGSVLLALLGIEIFKELNAVQETILNRQLAFRRIALADVASSIVMTAVAPYLAWQGWGAWSLVMERFSGQATRMVVVWFTARPWRPYLGWDGEVARWFGNFSFKVWSGITLNFVLERFDDFWIGASLGQGPLGLYGRAYEFAGYPRRVVANPILSVFFPTFARLQQDRLRLSKAFFRATSVMIRTDFWFSLVLILTAPEFIQILGQQWQPMQTTFQFMILYALLDPLAVSASNLLLATGHPELNVQARVIQLTVFVPAVIILSRWRGIEGVALAADLMIAVGVLFLFYHTRRLVDYSLRRLLFWPVVALIVSAAVVLLLNPLWATWDPWLALPGKAILVTCLYGGVLGITEREQLRSGWQMVWEVIGSGLRPVRGSTR